MFTDGVLDDRLPIGLERTVPGCWRCSPRSSVPAACCDWVGGVRHAGARSPTRTRSLSGPPSLPRRAAPPANRGARIGGHGHESPMPLEECRNACARRAREKRPSRAVLVPRAASLPIPNRRADPNATADSRRGRDTRRSPCGAAESSAGRVAGRIIGVTPPHRRELEGAVASRGLRPVDIVC